MSTLTAIRRESADTKIVYSIGGAVPLDDTITSAILGFKAYNLARMAALGLNVPPAFVLGTGFCAHPEDVMPSCWRDALIKLEEAATLKLGESRRPLLLSVRSGAPVSMPLQWSQVRKGLDPARYTIRTVPGLVGKTKAWEEYCENERSLAAAIERLGRPGCIRPRR